MELVETQDDHFVLRLTRDELGTPGNALNETLEHLEEWEFSTRMGATPQEVRDLQDEIGGIFHGGDLG